VRLAERQSASRGVIGDWRSSACPMPVPRTDGVTQICVMLYRNRRADGP
jgi:hypothetical protein